MKLLPHDRMLFGFGVLTVLVVGGLGVLQSSGAPVGEAARPADGYHRAFELRNQLEADVLEAKTGRVGALLVDCRKGHLERPYTEALIWSSVQSVTEFSELVRLAEFYRGEPEKARFWRDRAVQFMQQLRKGGGDVHRP